LDLLADGLRALGGSVPDRLGGVCGSTESVRAHVRDRSSLPSCSCGGDRNRSAHLTRNSTCGEAAADRCRDAKLATGKRARARDGIVGTTVMWSCCLKQSEHVFRAIRSPRRNDPTFGFTQCLHRNHRPESSSL
jgi:hypothetical protein